MLAAKRACAVVKSHVGIGSTRIQIYRSSLQLCQWRCMMAAPQMADTHTMPIKALLVDAAGTLIRPSEDVATIYRHYAQEYGCKLTEAQILQNFRKAFASPWTDSLCRYSGDGRPFWKFIIAESTGCSDPALLETLYVHYAQPEAWTVSPDAAAALASISAAGLKLAVVSNFDTRLRPLLAGLGISRVFDAIVVSAEVAIEKPNPVNFEHACNLLGVQPREAVHVGDDRRNDIVGARLAGCHAWLWGSDVHSFHEVEQAIAEFNRAAAAAS